MGKTTGKLKFIFSLYS